MAQPENSELKTARKAQLRILLITAWVLIVGSGGLSLAKLPAIIYLGELILSCGLLWYLAQRLAWLIDQKESILAQLGTNEVNPSPAQSRPQQNELLASMNHEIRTPLAAITGISEILVRGVSQADLQTQLQTLVTASHHLDQVVNSFLKSGQTELPSGDLFALNSSACEISALIEDRINVLKVVAAKTRTELNCNTAAIVNQVFLVDQVKLSQLLMNLVSNAIKFADGGHVEVRAFLTDQTHKNVVLRVEVRDSGIGLTEHQIANLFRRFVIVDSNASNPFGVTGLGLAKSQLIVNLMSGKLNVSSLLGEGSVFTFELPLERAVTTVEIHAELPIERPPETFVTTPLKSWTTPEPILPTEQNERLKTLHVLVAEDNSSNQIVISSILRFLKVPFTLVTDGEAAFQAVKSGNFDLVLMDCQMPVTDGYDATRKIRAFESQVPSRKRIPIIALTASSSPDEQEHCLRAGMDLYTTKPISSNLLRKALLKVLPVVNSKAA